MKTKLIIACAAIVLGAAAVAYAATTYKYECPKCHAVVTYSSPSPGVKCATDGYIMVSK